MQLASQAISPHNRDVSIKAVFDDGERHTFKKGQVILPSGRIYYILNGAVAAYSLQPQANNLLFVYKDDEFFPSFYPNEGFFGPIEYSYKSLNTTEALSIPWNDFMLKMDEGANAKPVIATLMENTQLLMERIDNMQQGNVRERLVNRLNFFIRRIGIQKGNRILIEIPMSHVDLATSIGTTRETVNRYMSSLEKNGIITINKNSITIHSVSDLQRFGRALSNTKKLD